MQMHPALGTAYMPRAKGRWGQWQFFFKSFLKHPREIASICPSSQALIACVLAPISWNHARVIVEYGPGIGTISTAILARMPAQAHLVLCETNSDFCAYLRTHIRDARVRIFEGSAADIGAYLERQQLGKADYVISGIPFSTIDAVVAEAICASTASHMRAGGAFIAYQFSDCVAGFMRRHFKRLVRAFVWRNMPPAHIFVAQVPFYASCAPAPREQQVESREEPVGK